MHVSAHNLNAGLSEAYAPYSCPFRLPAALALPLGFLINLEQILQLSSLVAAAAVAAHADGARAVNLELCVRKWKYMCMQR